MKKFFSNLFGKGKKELERKPVVAQISLVAQRTVLWKGCGDVKFLNQCNQPTFVPLSLDIPSGQFWEDLRRLVYAAIMTISCAESALFFNFRRQKARVVEEELLSKKVLLRVWPSSKFMDPVSAEFYDAVSFAAASGQPIEIMCKWAD